MKTISESVRQKIAESGMTQSQLSEASGVSQGRISEFLSGGTINSDNLDKIAAALFLKILQFRPKDS